MSGFGNYNGQNPMMNNSFQFQGGFPQPGNQQFAPSPNYASYMPNPQMPQQQSPWLPGYPQHPNTDIRGASPVRNQSPVPSNSPSPFKGPGQVPFSRKVRQRGPPNRGSTFPKPEVNKPEWILSRAELSKSVDELKQRVNKLEASLFQLKRGGKRPGLDEVEGQPATKIAKGEIEPTKDKGKSYAMGTQNVNFRITDGKIVVSAVIRGSLVDIDVPIENIVLNKKSADLKALENIGEESMLVNIQEFVPFGTKKSIPTVKKAEINTVPGNTVEAFMERFRSNNLESMCIMKGTFIYESKNWIQITRKIDGKIRLFEVPHIIVGDKFGIRPIKNCIALKDNFKSEIFFKLHRVLLHDEIQYFISDAWADKRPTTAAAYECRVPNIENTDTLPAKFNVISAKLLSATCTIDGEKVSFEVGVDRVKVGLNYCKSLYEVDDKLKFCYICLRKMTQEGKTTYRPVCVLLKTHRQPKWEAQAPTVVVSVQEPGSPNEDMDVASFTVVDEVHDDEDEPGESMPSTSVADNTETFANETFFSAVRDDDRAVFYPVSDREGYIHWKTDVFKITPSDLWQEEAPFVDFNGLCASPAHCRIAVVEDNDGAVHNDFIVASLGELPSPDSMMKIVRGQPGILKFVNESDKESMVITVDQKEYPILLSQLFLSGKLIQSLDDVKEYYTRKLTVLFDQTGSEVRSAFHPTRPDVKLKAGRCLIEVTHSRETNDGVQVYVMTGQYKGITFSYIDDELKDVDDFSVLDCDILLSETNTFVLGDFNMLDTRRSITPMAQSEHRIVLSRKFSGQVRKSLKSFFDNQPSLQLPATTSSTVVGMKVVNRLLDRLDDVLEESLDEVLDIEFRDCFPDKAEDLVRSFFGEYSKEDFVAFRNVESVVKTPAVTIKKEM